jgi:Na+-driven multidrug efflux pump
VALVFNNDASVVASLVDYLRIVPWSYGLLGLLLLANASLNALTRPLQATLLTVLRLFVLFIPLAFLGSTLFGLHGIFGAAAAANGLVGVAACLWLRRILASSRPGQPQATRPKVAEVLPVAGE